MALDCVIVVDRMSVEHSLGEDGRRQRLSLLRLLRWFRASGLEPVEIAVAAAFVPAVRGVGGNPVVARKLVQNTIEWFDGQAREVAAEEQNVRVRPLWGAHNGQREVAVDLAVAAAALEAASDTGPNDVDLVVICSRDSDFHHLHRYARRVPILVAASFTKADRQILRKGRVPAIHIPTADGAQFAAAARGPVTSSLTQQERDGQEVLVDHTATVRSGSLTRLEDDPVTAGPALNACKTIAVVDPYGLFNLAVRSIGVGDLPNVDSVRSTLQDLGWDYPMGVLATIPDVRLSRGNNQQKQVLAPGDIREAWILRDEGLDELAASFEHDDDPLTEARRAELRPERADHDTESPTDRDIAAASVKRLATGLLADLWLAVVAAPDADHVLIGEDPDLLAALELLPLCGIHTYDNVVRVGVHAGRDRLELPPGLESPAPAFVLLADVQLAELTCVSDQVFGGRHRSLLHGALKAEVQVTAAGTDPETGAKVIHLLVQFDADGDAVPEEHQIKSLLSRGVAAVDGVQIGGLIQLEHEDLRLVMNFDRTSRCSHPVVMYQPQGQTDTHKAIVLSQEGNWITVDLNGDGIADTRVPIGHETLNFGIKSSVLISLADNENANLVDAGSGLDNGSRPEIIRIERLTLAANTPFWVAQTIEGVEGDENIADDKLVEGHLVTTSGHQLEDASRGDYLFAIRRSSSDGSYFVAMSTPLKHLRRRREGSYPLTEPVWGEPRQGTEAD
jgi:hypothetical protein